MIISESDFLDLLKHLANKNPGVKHALEEHNNDYYQLSPKSRKIIDNHLEIINHSTRKIVEIEKTCHDCGCKEGEFHKPGCDMERCPFCGRQLISCGCCYRQLGFNYKFMEEPYSGLPKEIYENGLTPELEEKWEKILQEKGLIPYIVYPIICVRCGDLWPELFHVSDEEWNHYIEPGMQRSVICKPCFEHIKKLIDAPR